MLLNAENNLNDTGWTLTPLNGMVAALCSSTFRPKHQKAEVLFSAKKVRKDQAIIPDHLKFLSK